MVAKIFMTIMSLPKCSIMVGPITLKLVQTCLGYRIVPLTKFNENTRCEVSIFRFGVSICHEMPLRTTRPKPSLRGLFQASQKASQVWGPNLGRFKPERADHYGLRELIPWLRGEDPCLPLEDPWHTWNGKFHIEVDTFELRIHVSPSLDLREGDIPDVRRPIFRSERGNCRLETIS